MVLPLNKVGPGSKLLALVFLFEVSLIAACISEATPVSSHSKRHADLVVRLFCSRHFDLSLQKSTGETKKINRGCVDHGVMPAALLTWRLETF